MDGTGSYDNDFEHREQQKGLLKVEQVFSDRKRFLDLLLLADEQEDMIDRYLERGDMFALYDEDKLRAVCVVTNEGKEFTN